MIGISLAGAGNHEEIVGGHNPEGVIADYWDFDEDSHDHNQSSTRDSISNHPLPRR